MKKLTKAQKRKRQLERLLRKFSLRRPKNGDLVITAEINRVVDANWGVKNTGHKSSREISVVEVWPERRLGGHIVSWGRGGQQSVFILKGVKK